MIDLLKLVETLEQVALAWSATPKHVPLMVLSVAEIICFENGPHEFCVAAKYFVEQLVILDLLLPIGIGKGWRNIDQKLVFRYGS